MKDEKLRMKDLSNPTIRTYVSPARDRPNIIPGNIKNMKIR